MIASSILFYFFVAAAVLHLSKSLLFMVLIAQGYRVCKKCNKRKNKQPITNNVEKNEGAHFLKKLILDHVKKVKLCQNERV